jgi:hypothetical protein
MLEDHHFALLLEYLVASLAGGFLAIWFTTALVRRVKVMARTCSRGWVSDFWVESGRCCVLEWTELSPDIPQLHFPSARLSSILLEDSCSDSSVPRILPPRRPCS